MIEEKERLKSDMVAPQPSEHPKITYRLVFSSIGKRGD